MNSLRRLAVALWTGSATALLAGAVSYPALGHVDMEEGTIEVWFTPMTELHPDVGDKVYTHIFRLFELQVENEFGIGCTWYARPSRHGLKVSTGSRRLKEGMAGLLGSPLDHWKTGEPHHVAFTWHGRDMALWADGVRIAGRQQMIGFTGKPGKARLFVGDRDSKSPIIVHAVRVSSVARGEPQLQQAKPVADLATMLLDVFSDPPADRTTRPTVISELQGEQGGRLVGDAHFTPAPAPGLRLYR